MERLCKEALEGAVSDLDTLKRAAQISVNSFVHERLETQDSEFSTK